MILVSGATGHLGRAIISHLHSMGATEVIAGVRKPDKSNKRQRAFDYDHVEEMCSSLQGIEHLVFISGITETSERIRQHRNVIDAARTAGIKRITYTSFITVYQASSKFPFSAVHKDTEAYLKHAGITTTFIRNGYYMENLQPGFEAALKAGVWDDTSSGHGKAAYVCRMDLAEAIAKVTLMEGKAKASYDMTGPEALDMKEVIEQASNISHQRIQYQQLSIDAMEKIYEKSGLPTFLAHAISVNGQAIDAGEYQQVTQDLETILGRKPTTLKELMSSWLSQA